MPGSQHQWGLAASSRKYLNQIVLLNRVLEFIELFLDEAESKLNQLLIGLEDVELRHLVMWLPKALHKVNDHLEV